MQRHFSFNTHSQLIIPTSKYIKLIESTFKIQFKKE